MSHPAYKPPALCTKAKVAKVGGRICGTLWYLNMGIVIRFHPICLQEGEGTHLLTKGELFLAQINVCPVFMEKINAQNCFMSLVYSPQPPPLETSLPPSLSPPEHVQGPTTVIHQHQQASGSTKVSVSWYMHVRHCSSPRGHLAVGTLPRQAYFFLDALLT